MPDGTETRSDRVVEKVFYILHGKRDDKLGFSGEVVSTTLFGASPITAERITPPLSRL